MRLMRLGQTYHARSGPPPARACPASPMAPALVRIRVSNDGINIAYIALTVKVFIAPTDIPQGPMSDLQRVRELGPFGG